jgi:hypothetical protein
MMEKIAALMGGLRLEDLDHASPIQRQHFAALCRHWADLAERRNEVTKAGILGELKNGDRSA